MTTIPQPHPSRPAPRPRRHGVAGPAERLRRRRWRRLDDSPPAGNADPVAAFSAPDSIVAGSAARFDAAASSDADGDALTYSWEFSSGSGARRGGGKQIAQAFATPGTYTVRLTVADGRGGVASASRTLAVTPGPVSAGNVDTTIVVRDRSGAPLADVTVANADSCGQRHHRRRRPGDARHAARHRQHPQAEQGRLRRPDQDARLAGRRRERLPRNDDGTARAGADAGRRRGRRHARRQGRRERRLRARLHRRRRRRAGERPGAGRDDADRRRRRRAFLSRPLRGPAHRTARAASSSATARSSSPSRRPADRCSSHPAAARRSRFPRMSASIVDGSLVKAGDTTPLWSLDETTGGWVEEGSGTVVASATSPSGFALRAEVTHFSWWNADDSRSAVRTAGTTEAEMPGRQQRRRRARRPDRHRLLLERRHRAGAAGIDLLERRRRRPAASRRRRSRRPAANPGLGGRRLDPGRRRRGPADPGRARHHLPRVREERHAVRHEDRQPRQRRRAVDVPILLEPVAGNPGTLAATLPYDERIVINAIGETDRFTFTAEAGTNYEVQVARNPSSLLSGAGAGARRERRAARHRRLRRPRPSPPWSPPAPAGR